MGTAPTDRSRAVSLPRTHSTASRRQASRAFPGPALSTSYRFQAGAAARCRRTGGSGLTGRHHSRALILLSLAFTSLPLAGNASSERCPCREHAAQRREPEGVQAKWERAKWERAKWEQAKWERAPRAGRGLGSDRRSDSGAACVFVWFWGGAPRRVGRTRSGRAPQRRSCGERKRQSSTARCVRALVGSK